MIFTDRTITVRKGESRIDEPIVVYRGDYELEVRFTILNSRFKFMSGTNMIESEKASYGQLAILTPYGGNIFSDIVKCNDGSVTFVLTAEMLNQIEEVGLYSFQIRLMDYNKESRVSIPPIEFGIEVREPIASEDHDNSVNNAIVGYSIAKVVDPKEENVGDTFNESGNYNKTKWETGDRISQGKLNKIEDAIDKINKNEMNNSASLSKRIDSNFNVLDATKADKNEVFTMANMGQDIKEAMTGGSVAVVGENSVDTINILDGAVTPSKMDLSCDNLLRNKPLTNQIHTGLSISSGTEHRDNRVEIDHVFFKYEINEATILRLIDTSYKYAITYVYNGGDLKQATVWMQDATTVGAIFDENKNAAGFILKIALTDNEVLYSNSLDIDKILSMDYPFKIDGDNIKDESISRNHYSKKSIGLETVDDEFLSGVGIEYIRKSVTVDDFAIGNEYLNSELLPEFLFFKTKLELYYYDWLCFDNSISEFEFDYDQQDLYLVLSANDYDAYVICISPVLNEVTTGKVITFTKSSKKQEMIYKIENLQNIPQSRMKMQKEGNTITIYSNGERCVKITGIPDGKYGMGILLHSGFIADVTTLKNLSINSIKNTIKDRIDEVEKDIKNRLDTVEYNFNVVFDGYIHDTVIIELSRENLVFESYWNHTGATFNTTYKEYSAYKELVQVEYGDTLILRNWGEYPGPTALAYSAYDNDGLPYDGKYARLNYSSGVYNDITNEWTFEIPKGCTQIGLSVKGDYSDAKAIITKESMGISNIVKEEVAEAINTLDIQQSTDKTSKYFDKGCSEKSFNKKICIICAGQSNTDGRVPISKLPSYISLPLDNIHYASNYNGLSLKDGLATSDLSNNRWAFDLVTYYNITQVAKQELYVIKYTRGGTSIDKNGATNYHWTADYEELSSISYSLLWSFEDLIRKCIKAKGEDFDIRAMIWHQGEGDYMDGVNIRYYDNLKNMIAYCRGIVGNSRLPFICGTVTPNSGQYSKIVEDAFKRLNEEDPYFYLVDMSGAPLLDAYHFNETSSEYFGKCVYDYLIDAGVISATKLNPTKPW